MPPLDVWGDRVPAIAKGKRKRIILQELRQGDKLPAPVPRQALPMKEAVLNDVVSGLYCQTATAYA